MTISETPTQTTTPTHNGETVVVEEEVVIVGPLAGNPMLLGLPVFVAASVALGLTFVGYVSTAGHAGALPIIMMSTGIGLLITTVWAIALGQSAVACVFGIFSGFWLSYSALLLGLTHNWFAIGKADVTHTVAAFLITWLVIIGLLTLAMLRLPLAFTTVNVLIDIALVLILIGTIRGSQNFNKAGGWVAFLFAAVGAYIFVGTASVATGGKPLPLGRPVIS
jgi:succinate-acetate transporter protein